MKCPMPQVLWVYNFEDSDEQTPLKKVCGADLHILMQGHVDLDALPEDAIVPTREMFHWAENIAWRVECMNGHVIAVQDSDSEGEAFVMEQVLNIGPKLDDLMILRSIEEGLRP